MPKRVGVSLPAFTCVGERVDLWPDVPGLSYGDANLVGQERANELIDIMRRTESPSLLGNVVEAICNGGRYGGLEIGFFHGLSQELLSPMPVREFVEVPPCRDFPALAQRGHLRLVG